MPLRNLSKREYLGIFLKLQVVIALTSPAHLEHLRRERQTNELTDNEIIGHFAGAESPADAHEFAEQFRSDVDANWSAINSPANFWYAGIRFEHDPDTLEAALYYFCEKGLFRLSPEMLPEIIATLNRVAAPVS